MVLSNNCTKIIHLQNDRTIELQTQGGFHHRTRTLLPSHITFHPATAREMPATLGFMVEIEGEISSFLPLKVFWTVASDAIVYFLDY